jgi:hypothetical protein
LATAVSSLLTAWRLVPLKPMCQLNRVAQWHRLAQFHPSMRKNPFRSIACALGRAKLCHRLTQGP